MQVDVALDLVRHLLELDPARRGVGHVAHRVAEAESCEQELHRVRALILAEQDGRLVTLEREPGDPRLVLGARMLEGADLRRRVCAVLPAVDALNVNWASSGWSLIASIVPSSAGTSMPLETVIVLMSASIRG